MRLTIGGKVGLLFDTWIGFFLFSNVWGLNGQIFPCRIVTISIDYAPAMNRRRMRAKLVNQKNSNKQKTPLQQV